MVAAWGGYVFVINMVGIHAFVMAIMGRVNQGVYKAYTIFFIIGTIGAIQIPVVGWTPLRSLEQVGPLFVFFWYQLLQISEMLRRWKKYDVDSIEFIRLRIRVFMIAIGLGATACSVLIPMVRNYVINNNCFHSRNYSLFSDVDRDISAPCLPASAACSSST
jgi:dolichyl-diphosphooligosaccharide--protein glycosyltransferase